MGIGTKEEGFGSTWEACVTSCIMVAETCVQRHGTKISLCKVHGCQCMCKMVESVHAAIETHRRIFC